MLKSKSITFITGHYYNSARRAGFHNLADAAHRAGFQVNFVTTGYSLLSYLRRDYRTKIRGICKNFNAPIEIRPGFISYVHFTAWHPMTTLSSLLNRLSAQFMPYYGEMYLGPLLSIIKTTDVFIFESTPGLFLFERIQCENPDAIKIYRVSDDIRMFRSTHPAQVDWEQTVAPKFALVSVPYTSFLPKFEGANLRLQRHGLDKTSFDDATTSPFSPGSKNATIATAWEPDWNFFKSAAPQTPECTYHIFGPWNDRLGLSNVKFYGEVPFKETVKYIKFSDVGLHCIKYRDAYSSSITDPLKVIQYRYCGLPIVSPDFLDLNREGVFYYSQNTPETAVHAMCAALAAGKNSHYSAEVRSWDEVLEDILANAGVSA